MDAARSSPPSSAYSIIYAGNSISLSRFSIDSKVSADMQSLDTFPIEAYTGSTTVANRPANPDLITSTRQWARSGRTVYPGSSIESGTHESGTAVSELLAEKHLLPDFQVVPAQALQARALYKHDAQTNVTTLATLEEALEYLYQMAPPTITRPPELQKPCNEGTLSKNASKKTYDNLFLLGKHMIKQDAGFPWKFQSEGEFTSSTQITGNARSDLPDRSQTGHVRADAAFVLTHTDYSDVSDKSSQWLRTDQLKLDTLPDQMHKTVKNTALIMEFKRLRTNETFVPKRASFVKKEAKKTSTRKARVSDQLRNKYEENLVEAGIFTSLQQLRDKEAEIAQAEEWTPVPNIYCNSGPRKMMPAGRKSPTLFAQAVIYAQAHRADTLILDDWSAPKALRFEFLAKEPNQVSSATDPEYPLRATFAHLQKWRAPGEPDDGQVTVEEAGMFFLADNLSLIEASWLPRVFVHPFPASSGTGTDSDVASQTQFESNPVLLNTADDLAINIELTGHIASTSAMSEHAARLSISSSNTEFWARGTSGPEQTQIRSKGTPTRDFHTDQLAPSSGPARRTTTMAPVRFHHPYAGRF